MNATTPQPAPAAALFPLQAIASAAVGRLGDVLGADWHAAPGTRGGTARLAPATGGHGFTLLVAGDDLAVVDEWAETFVHLFGRHAAEPVGALAQAVTDAVCDRLDRDAELAARIA